MSIKYRDDLGIFRLGPNDRPKIIAEISANHRSNKSKAIELIQAVADAGVDAVKFQHFTAETITVRSEHSDFQVRGNTPWDGRQLADLYAEAMMPWDWTADLVQECQRLGLEWFSSPFDRSAIDFLEQFNISAYKIASFEIVDLPLIRYAASKRKPLIISTGMATFAEIDAAVTAAIDSGATGLALLRCNSTYPAAPQEMDLRAIPVMQQSWGLHIGLSDHTLTSSTAIAAVALGARIIEKHVTLRRSDGGPDAAFSLEPSELVTMIRDIGDAHDALGSVRFGPSVKEHAAVAFRRSLRAVRPIKKGELITANNVRSVRPAGGLPPDMLADLLGKSVTADLKQGDPITISILSK
jgi:pseudaminic acid synthase